MNISSTTSVQAATSAAPSDTADSVNILVLEKALDMQATAAMALFQQPSFASEGSWGHSDQHGCLKH